MSDYAEDGLTLLWSAAETIAGALPGTRRALVHVAPPHPGTLVRGLCSLDGGPEREVRAIPLGLDRQSRSQLFALDLPAPPPGSCLSWHPIAACAGREADPRRGGVPAATLHGAPAEAPPAQPALVSYPGRFPFTPQFLFRVTAPVYPDATCAGETPDGLLMLFKIRPGGTVDGPALKGEILPLGGDWMRIRRDGIGICHIHARIRPVGGGIVQTEYTGVVDFGPDGYQRVATGRLPPRAPLRFAPRYFTAEPRLLWLNRLQCFSVGEVNLETHVVEYDLYAFPAQQPVGI